MTTTTKLLAVLLTVISTTGFAKVNDSTFVRNLKVLPKTGSDSYKVIYQAQTAEPVFVSIKDAQGSLLLSERYARTSGFILPVNLENAKSGTYQVEIKGKQGSVSETIDHTSQADILKNRLFIQENKNKIALVGYDLGVTQLQVLVFNGNQELVYKDQVTTDGVINKSYDLNAIKAGAEVVVYHENDALISKTIDLK